MSVVSQRIILPLSILLILAAVWQAPSVNAQGALFREVSASTGLVFQHFNGATGNYYLPELLGAGAAYSIMTMTAIWMFISCKEHFWISKSHFSRSLKHKSPAIASFAMN